MKRVKEALSFIVAQYLAPNSKAVAGFVGTAAVSLLVRSGVDPDVTVAEVVRSAVDGLVAAVVVWFSPANKPR